MFQGELIIAWFSSLGFLLRVSFLFLRDDFSQMPVAVRDFGTLADFSGLSINFSMASLRF